jgi:TolB-like protein
VGDISGAEATPSQAFASVEDSGECFWLADVDMARAEPNMHRVHCVVGRRIGGEDRNRRRAAAPAEAKHLSIVVLPFTNLSNDPTQDYFADGITENLTTDASRLSGSFVIARNTAFTFKGKNVDAREIGKELGVRNVLEGSVQRDAGRMRVNVQLIDAERGEHLWAERFDKPLADLFEMQDEIVARLAKINWGRN